MSYPSISGILGRGSVASCSAGASVLRFLARNLQRFRGNHGGNARGNVDKCWVNQPRNGLCKRPQKNEKVGIPRSRFPNPVAESIIKWEFPRGSRDLCHTLAPARPPRVCVARGHTRHTCAALCVSSVVCAGDRELFWCYEPQ